MNAIQSCVDKLNHRLPPTIWNYCRELHQGVLQSTRYAPEVEYGQSLQTWRTQSRTLRNMNWTLRSTSRAFSTQKNGNWVGVSNTSVVHPFDPSWEPRPRPNPLPNDLLAFSMIYGFCMVIFTSSTRLHAVQPLNSPTRASLRVWPYNRIHYSLRERRCLTNGRMLDEAAVQRYEEDFRLDKSEHLVGDYVSLLTIFFLLQHKCFF